MKAFKKKPAEELRMSSAEFDRIMGRALQVKPEIVSAKKKTRKAAKKKISRR